MGVLPSVYLVKSTIFWPPDRYDQAEQPSIRGVSASANARRCAFVRRTSRLASARVCPQSAAFVRLRRGAGETGARRPAFSSRERFSREGARRGTERTSAGHLRGTVRAARVRQRDPHEDQQRAFAQAAHAGGLHEESASHARLRALAIFELLRSRALRRGPKVGKAAMICAKSLVRSAR